MFEDLHLVRHITDIRWGWAHYWYYALIVMLVCLAIVWYWCYKSIRFFYLLNTRVDGNTVKGFSVTRVVVRAVLFSVAIIALFVASLRPQQVQEPKEMVQEGRDVLFAIDISRSMAATDLEPNRLEAAKEKIKQMIPLLSCERVGLILFAGAAIVQCPFTADLHLFSLFLDDIDPQTISTGSTSIGSVLHLAVSLFGKTPDKKNKVLVMVTDGEDFSPDLQDAIASAQKIDLHVYAMGVASQEGAPVPIFDYEGKVLGYEKDGNGQVVISRLSEQGLIGLTKALHGTYVRISSGMNDIATIVEHLKKYQRERFDDLEVASVDELYRYPLWIVFICLCGEWLL